MTDQPPLPRIKETCPCGADVEVTAADAATVVDRWRASHHHGPPADRRTGVGFAATSTPPRPRTARWAPNLEQEIRA